MVKQRQKSDCCIAAVANAVGASYAAVKKVYGSTRGGLDYHDTLWLLSEFGEWHETRVRKPKPVVKWLPRHQLGRYVLILRSGFLDEFHAIAVVDGVTMGHYKEWMPVIEYYRLEVVRSR